MNTNSEETTFSRQLKLFRNAGWNNAFADCCTEKQQKQNTIVYSCFYCFKTFTQRPTIEYQISWLSRNYRRLFDYIFI